MDRGILLSEKEEWEGKLKSVEARDEKYRKKVQSKIDKKVHALHIQELKIDAREAEVKKNPEEAARLDKRIKDEEAAWNRDHPVKSTRQDTNNSQGSAASQGSRTRVNNASGPRAVKPE